MNGVSGVQGSPGNAGVPATAAANKSTAQAAVQTGPEVAAVYEKGGAAAPAYTRDSAAVGELRLKDRAYIQNLQNVVSQLLGQLNHNTLASSQNKFLKPIDASRVESYWDLLIDNGDGTFSWHPDLSEDARNIVISKAQEDIGENGYYGVKQTSARLLDFAKAITGGDPSKIGLMREYVQKGFDEVEKMFGGKLPEISYQTLNAVMKGLDEWAAAHGSV
jgi:hypothetical protein